MKTLPEIPDRANLPAHAAEVIAEIERLHDKAEELADRSKHVGDLATAEGLRDEAKRLVIRAARLRAQIEEA